ncbi:hypothetical protein VK86_08825 [Moellerella wisconsensis]|nr:hypothetical protein VK86_08825 [Moellerella wisconsensis]
MNIKSVVFTLLLTSISFSSLSAPITTVSKKQIGADKWPFTREEVMLECRSNGALMVINPATLMQYPINDIAIKQMKNREINATPIDILLLDDPQQSGMKMDIAVIQQAAQGLCHND